MSGGRDPRELNQAGVIIKTRINKGAIAFCQTNGSSSDAMFACGGEEGVHDMFKGQVLFTLIDIPSLNKTDPRAPVQTSLNGAGSASKQMFPDDPLMQARHLLSRIRVVGLSTNDISYKKDKSISTGVSCLVAGLREGCGYVDMPFGLFAKVVVHTSDQIREFNIKPRQGINPNQVTVGIIPYNPQSAGMEFYTSMQLFARDRKHFSRQNEVYMNQVYVANKLQGACKTVAKADLFQMLLGLYVMCKMGVIREIIVRPEFATVEPSATLTDKILALMRGMGVLPNSAQVDSVYESSPAQQEAFADAAAKIIQTMYSDLSAANLIMGYDEVSNSNPAIDETTGNLKTSTALGKAIGVQHSLPSHKVATMAEWISDDKRTILGKVVRPASAGNFFSLI